MTTLLQLPRLHYIVFQLIRFEVIENDEAEGAVTREPSDYKASSEKFKNKYKSKPASIKHPWHKDSDLPGEENQGAKLSSSPSIREKNSKDYLRPTKRTGLQGNSTVMGSLQGGGAKGHQGAQGVPLAVETDVVVMNVFPSLKEYQYMGRKEYVTGVGENNITVIKGGLAPRKITLEGTFGMRPIRMGTKIQNGYQRIEEFRQLFIKNQSIDPVKPSVTPPGKKYVYGMNFYDFTEPYWGSIEPDTLIIRSDAKTHSKLPMYKIQFTGLGKLIDVPSKDPIIRNLNYAIQLSELFDGVNAEIDNFMKNNQYAQLANEILVDWEMASDAVDAAGEMTSQYTAILNEVPLIGQSARMGTGYLLQGARLASVLGIPLLLANSRINSFGDLL